MEERGWYASSDEKKPGNLLKYALVVLTGVVFAATAIVMMLVTARADGSPNIGTSLLWALIAGVISIVIGVIIWYVYKAVKKR